MKRTTSLERAYYNWHRGGGDRKTTSLTACYCGRWNVLSGIASLKASVLNVRFMTGWPFCRSCASNGMRMPFTGRLDAHDAFLTFSLTMLPVLDDLRPHPRFHELRRRIGL